MKKTMTLYSITFLFLIILSGCNPKEKYTKTVDMPLAINAGQKLVVDTHVGSIKIIGNQTGHTNIQATITGKGETKEDAQAVAEAIKITVKTNSKQVTIHIDKPVTLKKDWFSVDFLINVPENIKIKTSTNVGSIKVLNIKGAITASSNVGSVECENIFTSINLHTNVGDIDVTYNANAKKDVHADLSVNVGSIRFSGPENLSAQLVASTNVGSIHSQRPITIQGHITQKKLKGTLGQGEGELRLKTNVGSITIK